MRRMSAIACATRPFQLGTDVVGQSPPVTQPERTVFIVARHSPWHSAVVVMVTVVAIAMMVPVRTIVAMVVVAPSRAIVVAIPVGRITAVVITGVTVIVPIIVVVIDAAQYHCRGDACANAAPTPSVMSFRTIR